MHSLILVLILSSSFVDASAIPPNARAVFPGVDVPISRRAPAGLARRWDQDVAFDFMFTMANCTRVKYNYTDPADCATFYTNNTSQRRGLERRQSVSEVSTTDWGPDVTYTGQVSFGSPAQPFTIVLDTGSSDLWVQTTQCTSCPRGSGLLNTNASSSFQGSSQTVQFSYGQGQAQGNFARDTVSFGGFSLTQTFGAVSQTFDNVIPSSSAGIMGLAFASLARTGAQPFWQALLESNQFSSPEFSFFLARNEARARSTTSANAGGALTLGGHNASLFQGDVDFQSFPSGVQSAFWWQEVASFSLNGSPVSFSNGLAAIDTGTTLLAGPQDAVENFWGAVPGSRSVGNGMFSFPCSTSLNVSISFGGPSFPINPVDLNFGQIGGGQCMGALFSMGATAGRGQPAWIIGDVFLKNVYTVFRANPPAVGFAQLSDAAGGSSGTPGPAPEGGGNSNSQNNGVLTVGPSVLSLTVSVLVAALGFAA